jgi:hypothetical protein
MRRGTQRLAVLMVVVCVAATSCAAAADQHSDSAGRNARSGEPLAVVVGGSRAALDRVSTPPPEPAAAVARRAALPPPITFRRTVDARSPLRVGFIGDSVAFSLVPTMQGVATQLIKERGFPFVAAGGFEGPGFGLTADVQGYNDIGPTAPASAYAHWRDAVSRMVFVDNPDVVIVLLGIWDTIERFPDGRALVPGTPEWEQWYGSIASQFVQTLTARGATVIWLVMPCVGRRDLNARLGIVNGVLRQTWRVAPGRVGYLNLSRAACRDGKPIYEVTGPGGPVRVREADGIHFHAPDAAVLMQPFFLQRFTAMLHGVLEHHARATLK